MFIVPPLFVQGEFVSFAKYNTIRNSLVYANNQLRPYVSPPMPYRLATNNVSGAPIGTLINSTSFVVLMNVSSFVGTNQTVALTGTLYDTTAGVYLLSQQTGWQTTRPNSGNNDTTVYNVSGVSIVFRITSNGDIGFFRTGTSNILGFSGWFYGGL